MSTGFTWGDLVLGHGGPYHLDVIDGWDTLPDIRVDAGDRANAHGGFDAPGWSSARTVVLEGRVIGQAARDDLERAFVDASTPGLRDLTGTVAGRTLTTLGRLTGRSVGLVARDYGGANTFPWAVQWRCPDPRRYADAVNGQAGLPNDTGGLVFDLFTPSGLLDFGDLGETGRVSVSNPGTATTPVMLRVNGPLPSGFELTEVTTGRRLRYVGPVASGQFVDLDSATGSVLLDGVADRRSLLTVAEWWQVPGRETREVLFSTLGTYNDTASLSVTHRPAYW